MGLCIVNLSYLMLKLRKQTYFRFKRRKTCFRLKRRKQTYLRFRRRKPSFV